MRKIVIQGVKGSFHDIAAQHYFSNEKLELVEADSFPTLFDAFEKDSSIDHAIIAIENTIAGIIMYNYSLLHNSNFTITVELLLRIKQNLLALPGTRLEDIEEIHAHPMALNQCLDFLKIHRSWRRIEREDTALCAAEIVEGQKGKRAAIASELAAETYGLEVLAEEIETNKQNFTRFLILSRKTDQASYDEQRNKASICFSLANETGSLSKVLDQLSRRSCNLIKIQSVPIVGKVWNYFFFVDFILENNNIKVLIDTLEDQVASLHVLGHYNKGIYYDS
jgi:prephenate dehydratase